MIPGSAENNRGRRASKLSTYSMGFVKPDFDQCRQSDQDEKPIGDNQKREGKAAQPGVWRRHSIDRFPPHCRNQTEGTEENQNGTRNPSEPRRYNAGKKRLCANTCAKRLNPFSTLPPSIHLFFPATTAWRCVAAQVSRTRTRSGCMPRKPRRRAKTPGENCPVVAWRSCRTPQPEAQRRF